MALLDILLYPNPKLRKKSAPIGEINEDIRLLLDDMLETMKNAEGIGIAAPQVGRNVRVVIVTYAHDREEKENEAGEHAKADMPVIEMVNPVIKKSSGEEYEPEGCLSIPGFVAEVKRKEKIEVEWLCRNGEKRHMLACGLTARIIQHETDHLDGILFVDRLGALKKEMMLKKMDRAFSDDSGSSRRAEEGAKSGRGQSK